MKVRESLKVDKARKHKVSKRYDHGLAEGLRESFMMILNHITGIILKPLIWLSTAYKGDLSNQGIKSIVILNNFF